MEDQTTAGRQSYKNLRVRLNVGLDLGSHHQECRIVSGHSIHQSGTNFNRTMKSITIHEHAFQTYKGPTQYHNSTYAGAQRPDRL